MKAALIAILLAACSKQAVQPVNEQKADAPATKPDSPAAKAFVLDEKNDLLEFHYAWSAEAAAVPQLVAQFRAAMNKTKAELLANAKSDKAERAEQHFDFFPYTSSTDFMTAGSTGRLLSLRVDVAAYTGGAHGNYGSGGLLWDRLPAKQIELPALFTAPANMERLLTQPWCDALNKAREEKRQEAVGSDGIFDECPKLSEISIIPTDKDGNGKFDRLVLVADPYVAGPYAEGDYEIELPVTGDLMSTIRSEYRENFEFQPQ